MKLPVVQAQVWQEVRKTTRKARRCPTCGGFVTDTDFTGMPGPKLECPRCGNKHNWKDGTRDSIYGEIQRYLCRKCGFRFSEL